jgi:hypothetical protein
MKALCTGTTKRLSGAGLKLLPAKAGGFLPGKGAANGLATRTDTAVFSRIGLSEREVHRGQMNVQLVANEENQDRAQ